MSITSTLTLSGSGIPNGTYNTNQAEVIASPLEQPVNITLTTSYVAYAAPSGATRLVLYPNYAGGANNIFQAGGSGDTGVNMGSNWQFAYIPVSAGVSVYLKCASGTSIPPLVGVWQ